MVAVLPKSTRFFRNNKLKAPPKEVIATKVRSRNKAPTSTNEGSGKTDEQDESSEIIATVVDPNQEDSTRSRNTTGDTTDTIKDNLSDLSSSQAGAPAVAQAVEVNNNSRIMYKNERNTNLMQAFNTEFKSFEGAKNAVWKYVQETGNQLKIRLSKPNCCCRFRCSAHENCPFDIRVNKVRGQDIWKLVGENLNHSNIIQRTKDKRKRKQRKFHLDDALKWQMLQKQRMYGRQHVPFSLKT